MTLSDGYRYSIGTQYVADSEGQRGTIFYQAVGGSCKVLGIEYVSGNGYWGITVSAGYGITEIHQELTHTTILHKEIVLIDDYDCFYQK